MEQGHNSDAVLESQGFPLFQNCPDYVVVLDQDGSVVYANPSFQVRFCPTGVAQGTSFFSYLDAASTLRMREMQPQLVQGSRQIELSHLTPEARTAAVHYCFFPLPDSGTGRSRMAGIGKDRAGDLASLLEIINLNLELERKQKELSEANARLELLAITDQITQLFNRHYFFQVAQHFWEEAKRYKLPLTLMLMDIDNFKAVNDTHGHLFGDHVLQQASARLKSNTRKSDILARYGGEEFVVLASNTDIQTGLVLAERLRLAVGFESFVMGSSSATVTLSVGISGTELAEFASFEDLLESGDQALYGAKRAGKNCVYQYSGGVAPKL